MDSLWILFSIFINSQSGPLNPSTVRLFKLIESSRACPVDDISVVLLYVTGSVIDDFTVFNRIIQAPPDESYCHSAVSVWQRFDTLCLLSWPLFIFIFSRDVFKNWRLAHLWRAKKIYSTNRPCRRYFCFIIAYERIGYRTPFKVITELKLCTEVLKSEKRNLLKMKQCWSIVNWISLEIYFKLA